MAEELPERLTQEALRRFGTPDELREYEEWVRARREMTDDHERRLRAVENQLTGLVGTVAELKSEAHETRIEQNAMLKQITSQIGALSDRQTHDAGMKAGQDMAMASMLAAQDRRSKWIFVLIPVGLAMAVYLLGAFINDTREQALRDASNIPLVSPR